MSNGYLRGILVYKDILKPIINVFLFFLSIRKDIPILLCTGFSETVTEQGALKLGVKGLLMKPLILKDLAEKIRNALDDY